MLRRLLRNLLPRRAGSSAVAERARSCAQWVERGDLEKALACCDDALSEHPDNADLLGVRAHVLYLRGDEAAAIEALRAAVQADPRANGVRSNLAQLLYSRLDLEGALEQLDAALAFSPEDLDLRLLRAGVLLSLGDYERGFADYEHRWARVAIRSRRFIFERPRWDGREPLAGRRVLAHAEQGFGDTLQFIRYVPLLAAAGADVIVQCHQELVRLLGGVQGLGGVFAKGEPLPPFDLQIPLGSLPFAYRTTLHDLPAKVPYLVPEAAERGRWRSRLDAAAVFKVGLAWKSNSASGDAQLKSFALAMLAPVLAVKDVQFISLQIGGGEEAAAAPIHDWTGELVDFAATAALVAELDLVITIDSAVAHVAGALGRPVWVVLPYLADWRWTMAGERTPWYPSARLFRQVRRGDWMPAIAAVATELAQACEKGRVDSDSRRG